MNTFNSIVSLGFTLRVTTHFYHLRNFRIHSQHFSTSRASNNYRYYRTNNHQKCSSSSSSSSDIHATNGVLVESSISECLKCATDLLPTQAILENFIHHNPLHHLESLSFSEAIQYAEKLQSYMSPGERVYHLVGVDPRKRANEALVDLCSAFIDRGAAKWAPNFRDKGFLYFFATLEKLGFAPWRKQARVKAEKIMLRFANYEDKIHLSESIIKENLEFFGISRAECTQGIRTMLLELPGWAGMFYRMEMHPSEAPANTRVALLDFCAVQSILARASVESLAGHSGWNPASISFATWISQAPIIRPSTGEPPHGSLIAHPHDTRTKLEVEFKQGLLAAIASASIPSGPSNPPRPELQVYTCIDDRECSLRRHVEQDNLTQVETFGVAGFFGLPIKYQPLDAVGSMILAPEGQTPLGILEELEKNSPDARTQFSRWRSVRKRLGRISLVWEKYSFLPHTAVLLSLLFPLSMARLMLLGISPSTKQKIESMVLGKIPKVDAHFQRPFPAKQAPSLLARTFKELLPKVDADFQRPFPAKQAANLLAQTFKDIGTQNRFAPIVIVLGHGASSVNNPYYAAYNCGACGGREGGANARLFARLGNDMEVRKYLLEDHNVKIPHDTVFVGGLHNTTSETVYYFDTDLVPESHRGQFGLAQERIELARGKNALERCRRFFLASSVDTPFEALEHVQTRATDSAEVRPELNHASNAAVLVGRRDLTKGLFLDRRAFLSSYDPFKDDDAGTNLEHVLAPALIVCSGINLEYLFSTIAVERHGAGTKSPLNVVGNIGVLQGTSGDLRAGLPAQMTEMHTPIRAVYVVDAPIERVQAVLARREDLRRLVRNQWVQFVVWDPTTAQFFEESNGQYNPIAPATVLPPTPFINHHVHGTNIARKENIIYGAATASMLTSCAIPFFLFGLNCMNPWGPIVAVCATSLSLPVLSFSRRYLHGEPMFARFAVLTVGLLAGFNLVALAPSLTVAMFGWSLFGFASTFLIGAYNDRATARNNATFAFAVYRVSDIAMLTAVALTPHYFFGGVFAADPIVAASLLVAALFKSSQFPLTSLFARSMEGPTPASALGYAGLSAHVGLVLLTSTMPLWFAFDWARLLLGTVGCTTAIFSTFISNIRAERKGAIAYATSGTIGIIFLTLALGYPAIALLLALGHASLRMVQILRAPNMLADLQRLRNALGSLPWPTIVSDRLYRTCWALRRFDTDFHLLDVLQWITRRRPFSSALHSSKLRQWFITAIVIFLAGFPVSPISHYLEEWLIEILPERPYVGGGILLIHFLVSVALIRYLFVHVLNPRRFKRL